MHFIIKNSCWLLHNHFKVCLATLFVCTVHNLSAVLNPMDKDIPSNYKQLLQIILSWVCRVVLCVHVE